MVTAKGGKQKIEPKKTVFQSTNITSPAHSTYDITNQQKQHLTIYKNASQRPKSMSAATVARHAVSQHAVTIQSLCVFDRARCTITQVGSTVTYIGQVYWKGKLMLFVGASVFQPRTIRGGPFEVFGVPGQFGHAIPLPRVSWLRGLLSTVYVCTVKCLTGGFGQTCRLL